MQKKICKNAKNVKFRNFPHGVHIHTQCTDGRSLKLSGFLKSACKYFLKIFRYSQLCSAIIYLLKYSYQVLNYACLAIFFSHGFSHWEIFTITHQVQSLQRSHIFILLLFVVENIHNSSSVAVFAKETHFRYFSLSLLLKILNISHQMQSKSVATLAICIFLIMITIISVIIIIVLFGTYLICASRSA